MTYQEAQLIRRTAIANMQPRKPTPEDEKLVPIAIRMLTYIAVLNYVSCDLVEELTASHLYKQRVKQQVNRSSELVCKVHAEAYQMLRRISTRASEQYNDRMESMYAKIQSAVLLPPPERAYNIFCSLCRLIEKDNIDIGGRYDFQPAKRLYTIPSTLSCAGLKDYRIDRIIEIAVEHL